MEMKKIAGVCLNLKMQAETKDKAFDYHPLLFGLLYISAGRTGITFDQKRSLPDKNSLVRICCSPFVDIISEIIVIRGF